MEQMTRLHRTILQECHVALTSSLNMQDYILDYMYSERVITLDLRRQITSLSSYRDKQVRILPHACVG